MTVARICFVLVTLVLVPASAQTVQPPVPDVPENGQPAQLTLNPILQGTTEGQPGTKVQPVIVVPEEAPPEPQRNMIIDAQEVRVPPSGFADFAPRSGLVPEPFCKFDSAKTIQETSAAEGPRCCEKIAEQNQSLQTDSSSDTRPDVTANSRGSSSGTLTAVFSEAAHFATGTCESGGNCSGQPPVMIYEGMSVRLTDDGCYEVRGIVEGPRVPAILRLQLTFFTRESKLNTVTLPPIRLQPEINSSQLANETQVWFIRRTGYSDVLRHWPGSEHGLTVTRSGTAQIGQIPDA